MRLHPLVVLPWLHQFVAVAHWSWGSSLFCHHTTVASKREHFDPSVARRQFDCILPTLIKLRIAIDACVSNTGFSLFVLTLGAMSVFHMLRRRPHQLLTHSYASKWIASREWKTEIFNKRNNMHEYQHQSSFMMNSWQKILWCRSLFGHRFFMCESLTVESREKRSNQFFFSFV